MVESRREPFHGVPTPIENDGFSKSSMKDGGGSRSHLSCSSPEFQSIEVSTPIVVSSGSIPHSSGHSDNSLESLYGNARGEMSESSPPDHSNIASNQRRYRSQQGNIHRPLVQRSSQAPSSNSGFTPPSSSSEIAHGFSSPSFQGSAMSYSPSNLQYGQQPGFFGQYPLSAHATPIPMAHGPPHYAYAPSYHQVVAENNMISQPMHPNYPSMLQPPPGAVFPYQRHSPDHNSPSHPSPFPVSQPQLYPPQLPASSQASPQIPATSASSNAISPYGGGSGPFHSLQYSSPSPYSYSYTTPVYHSQYPPHPPFHRYPSSGEVEAQATWYYLHHGLPQSPYESGPSYQARFPTLYVTSGRQEAENPIFDQHNPPPPPSLVDSSSPNPRQEGQASAESIRVHGTKPGIYNPTLTPASSSSGFNKALDKPVVRRSYHPTPPAHRSEWVMWAGNVPPDATHDELWRFFNQQPPERSAGSPEGTGVLSIFLISRSSCAFVNYKNDFFLQEAVSRFNGVPLRSGDSRCPRLVCRMRRLDDDLKAGVGGQRGFGMHTKWIKEKGKQRDTGVGIKTPDASLPSSPISLSERMAAAIATVSMFGDDNPEGKDRRQSHGKQSSSSGSFTSTNSSFLSRHFPQRYFILKSLTQHDLDLSVETGLWATQRHNEEILDQAFRTSKDVYLIFGANKTGEFYGYARMAGPVGRGQQRVSWASRSPQSSTSRTSQSPLASRGKCETFFHPNDLRLVETSPLPENAVTPQAEGIVRHSAPAMLGEPYQYPRVTPVEKFSLDQGLSRTQKDFHLDDSAPQRAMRDQESLPNVKPQVRSARSGPPLEPVDETEEKEIKVEDDGRQPEERKRVDTWGDSFPLEWLSTLRLPFHRTRDLRNPWNHDKEIKVSRDGIELEPSVGERLLEEWEKLAKGLEAQASSSTG